MFPRTVRAFGKLAALAAVALALAPETALAGSATANLSVSATVPQNCIISTTAMAFGNYDPVVTNHTAGAVVTGTATMTVTCTKGAGGSGLTPITVGLGPSANTGCSAPQRCLEIGGSTTDVLNYQLYSDSGHSVQWVTTANTESITGGITTPTSLTVYGQIPGAQDVTVGAYTDTVVATVNY